MSKRPQLMKNGSSLKTTLSKTSNSSRPTLNKSVVNSVSNITKVAQKQHSNELTNKIIKTDTECIDISTSKLQETCTNIENKTEKLKDKEVVYSTAVVEKGTNKLVSNRAKNGKGELVSIRENKTKEEIYNELDKLRKMTDILINNISQESWSMVELNKYSDIFCNNLTGSLYKKYYAPELYNLENKPFIELDKLIDSIPPILSYYKVSRVNNQYCNMHHVGETLNLLKMMFPYHDFSITKIFLNSSQHLRGLQLCMSSRIMPKYKTYYFSMPGKTEDGMTAIGSGKTAASLTYALKFNTCFSFFKTFRLKFKAEDISVFNNAENMLFVLNSYKNLYSSYIDPDYIYIFQMIMDAIGHYYIECGYLPQAQDFRLDILLKAFPVDFIIKESNIFLSEEEKHILKLDKIPGSDKYLFPRDYFAGYRIMKALVRDAVLANKIPKGRQLSFVNLVEYTKEGAKYIDIDENTKNLLTHKENKLEKTDNSSIENGKIGPESIVKENEPDSKDIEVESNLDFDEFMNDMNNKKLVEKNVDINSNNINNSNDNVSVATTMIMQSMSKVAEKMSDGNGDVNVDNSRELDEDKENKESNLLDDEAGDEKIKKKRTDN